MAATRTYLQTATDEGNLTTYTFSSQNFGTASADRHIIAVVFARNTTVGAETLSSVTIGGVSATILLQQVCDPAGANSTIAAICIAAVPTGTSGNVVVTWSEQMARAAVSLYSATGLDTTPHDTASSTAADPAVTIDVPADGFAIGGWTGSNTVTWTGLTEDADVFLGGSQFSVASDQFVSAEANRAVSINETGVDPVLVVASFGPASDGGGGLVAPVFGGAVFQGAVFSRRVIL